MRFPLHHRFSAVTCANTFLRIAIFLVFTNKWREVEYGGGQRRALAVHDRNGHKFLPSGREVHGVPRHAHPST